MRAALFTTVLIVAACASPPPADPSDEVSADPPPTASTAEVEAPPPKQRTFDKDPVAAEALFHEARRLMTEGKTAEACAKFEESLRHGDAAGLRLNLGNCYETLGDNKRACPHWQAAIKMTQGMRRQFATNKARAAGCLP